MTSAYHFRGTATYHTQIFYFIFLRLGAIISEIDFLTGLHLLPAGHPCELVSGSMIFRLGRVLTVSSH